MNSFFFLWSKFLKKIRGAAIKSSIVHKTSKVEAGSNFINSTMDRHSFCGYDCDINNTDIGAFCSIANNVIIGGGMHPVEWVGTSPVFYQGRDSVKAKFSTFERNAPLKTLVGNDVWIGQGAIIKQGVSIGDGAVIGMGSIVTKDVLPYSIVGGNPAREIRKRFNSNEIEKLLEIKWWNFSNEDLNTYAQYFRNPEDFLRHYSK